MSISAFWNNKKCPNAFNGVRAVKTGGHHENNVMITQILLVVKRTDGVNMDEPKPKPGYWATIPAPVRYDPAIPPSAKLLYAEISSLTDQRGYCYATDAYFESLYELSERTISRLLKTLENSGYIRIENGNGGRGIRKIYAGINPFLNPDKNVGVESNPDKNVYPTPTKMSANPDKNVGGIYNKKENKKKDQKTKGASAEWEPEMFERFWSVYPCKKDKASARREWDKLKPTRELMQDMSAALTRDKSSDEWQRGIGIPYACRWLSHRRWEDGEGSELSVDVPPMRLAGARC